MEWTKFWLEAVHTTSFRKWLVGGFGLWMAMDEMMDF
jgi:hypothetical protein